MRWLLVALSAPALVGLLFVANGLWPSWRTPQVGRSAYPPRSGPIRTIKAMAYNIAKCFVHQGGLSFRSEQEVTGCLDRIAAVVAREKPDLVFLSEINFQCSPCPVNQVQYLARKTRMHAHAFGENYSWGLPFYRIRSGNALLSQLPLTPVETQQLAGDAPFYHPLGNRRILWVEVAINNEKLLVGSLRNDSFDIDNNLVQVRQILRRIGKRPALLGGDFNAPAGSPPMQALSASGRFTGKLDGPPTFPTDKPDRCIDFILAPRAWRLLEHRVLKEDVSDHLPVVSTFALP